MKRASFVVTTALLAAALAALAGTSPLGPARLARHDAWRVIGPGGGGTMRRPAISPHDPGFVVLGCDMTGGYVTRDGGASWRMVNFGSVPTAFAFDPTNPSVVYAGAEAVYRSDDGGRTWRMVLPDPAKNTVARPIGDHGDRVFFTDDPAFPGSGRSVTVHAIAVDEDDPARVYVAAQAADSPVPGSPASPTLLLGSADGGRTWSRQTFFGAERILALHAGSRGRDPWVAALGESGAYLGAFGVWQHYPAPGGARFGSGSFGRDPRSGVVFAYATLPLRRGADGIEGGVQFSDDGGRTWRAANGSLLAAVRDVGRGEDWGPAKGSLASLGPIAVSARFPLVAYVGLRGIRLPGPGDAPFNGIAKTTDGGRSWTVVHAESDRPSANLDPSWIEARAAEDPASHSIWFDAPYDLAVAPNRPDVAYATDLFRTYRTVDGGRRWAQVTSERRGDHRWATRGLDVTTTYGVHFDPHDAKSVFISYTDIGLFRSEDGGETWTGSTNGIPRAWRNTTYWLAFDPEVKDLVWGGFSGTHDLPRPKMWRRTDPARFRGGVAVSTDGGRSWRVSNAGMEESAITHVLLDPRSPKGSRTLYATAFGRGVYKSTDNGRTWSLKNAGLAPDPRNQPFAWRLTRVEDGTLYLVVARRSERGRIGDRDDGALYRSTDGAEHWQPVALPAGTNGPNALTVDQADPKRLYLSAWGVAHPDGDTGGGIFLSTDAGATWRNVLPGAPHIYDVTADPRDPRALYACGFDQAAFRSADRGETWTRIRGFNFKWGHRVIPDPADAARIYVTTFGGSVWHGPAEGDPQAPEDVILRDPRQPGPEGSAIPAAPSVAWKLERLVEANILGTHAFQVALAWRDGKGDPACYSPGSLTEAQLAAIEAHQAALLQSDVKEVRAWAEGKPSRFDPKTDLEPLLASGIALSDALPVSAFTRWLSGRTKAPRVQVRAVASLLQTNLEVERDGDRLQELFAFYAGLGLPVYLGQLGLPGTDQAFLAMGRELEGAACSSPFGTAVADWQIAGRKNWNWGEKNLGIRDDKVLAKELLEEPDVKALVPRIRALPAQRIAVIGHSFTMQLHWSTPGAFVPVVTAIFARENPGVEFRQFQGGGMTSSRAVNRFYADVVAWKPQQVLLVVMNRTEEDLAAFRKLGRGLADAGAKVLTFDDVGDPKGTAPELRERELAIARETDMTMIEVSALLAAAPGRERFLCLDGIHMTEPYHRLMAKQWLAFLVGARGAALGR
ncbi:MAG TPA: hypothetical protein VLF95_08910 [Vicinamibacteria bacterium]|nr:hypothetical protein [Vicinamibacteria bacterium]